MFKRTIPIFFACDDNYAPFLGACIRSMLDNADKKCFYRIHILTNGFSKACSSRLLSLADDKSEIVLVDPTSSLRDIAGRLHIRDYYSITTYYRLFIAEMFPQYDKVLYLDADTIICGDISALYDTPIGDSLVAAVQEDVMNEVDVFGRYAEAVLGVPRKLYFNAGVLVMNLAEFRRLKIQENFVRLLSMYKFEVTQDQDYLNVLCRGSVFYLGYEWNKSPSDAVSGSIPSPDLIHYKLNFKPWHYANIQYADIFWSYAARSGFISEIRRLYEAFTVADEIKDRISYDKLMLLAAKNISDCESACSFGYSTV